MSASWIQDRRRKQAAGYKDDVNASLSDVMGGLQASLAVPETERQRKLAEEADAADLGAKKTTAETSLLRAKTDNTRVEESMLRRKGEESSRTARDEAKKVADDAKVKAESTKNAESVLRKRAASGADIETLIGAASADENLGEMDDDAVRGIQAEEAAKKEGATAKVDADKALTGQRDAAAAKLLRVPTGGGKGGKPVTPDKARKDKADADKAEADAKIAQRNAAGDGKPPKPLLTPAEVASVLEIQGAKDMLGRLEKMKTGKDGAGAIDTGPFAALGSFIASKAGAGDPRMVEFKALAGEQIAGYIKSISGATVSEPERKNLLENVPGVNDDDEEFLAKLKQVKDTLDAKLRLQKKAFAATGRDTAIFDVPDDVGAVPPAKPADMSDADIEARLKELKAKR